ncbi:MAG: hypothetical protein EXX96DRAFT_159879 [Benjaminiella poitrasii]|nr:MAG: hypothetical protein EXX96DRAFT_159879 [Benjaminiella poitrasii]
MKKARTHLKTIRLILTLRALIQLILILKSVAIYLNLTIKNSSLKRTPNTLLEELILLVISRVNIQWTFPNNPHLQTARPILISRALIQLILILKSVVIYLSLMTRNSSLKKMLNLHLMEREVLVLSVKNKKEERVGCEL